VAVKVLRLADDATLRRFDRERRAMGRLSELDGIVTIHYSGFTAAGDPYLVMPLLPGSLQEQLDRSEPMGWREAVGLMVVVARTVDEAHGQNVIHRDLKPGNILLTAGGAPLVADFGIAKLTGSNTAVQSTALTFTPSYSPPEVLEGAAPSKSADIYGLAATLYALIAGAPPFVTESDESVFALMRRIADEPVTDLRPRGVPDQVCAVIEKAMHKDVEHRHRTSADLATELEDALATVADEPPQARTTPDEPQDVGGDEDADLDQSTIDFDGHVERDPVVERLMTELAEARVDARERLGLEHHDDALREFRDAAEKRLAELDAEAAGIRSQLENIPGSHGGESPPSHHVAKTLNIGKIITSSDLVPKISSRRRGSR
jgi:serine/threonine protein kinase